MYKNKVLTERCETKDDILLNNNCGIKDTEIIITNPITKEVISRGRNSVIVPGSLFTAYSHFPRMANVLSLPTYNNLLGLDKITTKTKPDNHARQIWLFAVGTDGAAAESSQINIVDKTKCIMSNALVPFRSVSPEADLSSAEREIYFGRKDTTSKILYYFKTFDSDPVCYARYADGTNITSTMYTDNNKDPEVMVELNFKIEPEDVREWFKQYSAGGLADAKVNSLSLLSAWYTVEDDGYKYFQDIHPVTKYNFSTENLDDPDKGLDITYHLYY